MVKVHESELALVRTNFEDGVTKIIDFGENRDMLMKEIDKLNGNIEALDAKIAQLNALIDSLRDSSTRWEGQCIDLEGKLGEQRKMYNSKRLELEGLKESTKDQIAHLTKKTDQLEGLI